MHEWSLVQALLKQVEARARDAGASAVHRIRISIGEVSGVDADLFARAYEVFCAGTVCAGAQLEVSRPAARWECIQCGRSIGRGDPLQCTACALPARLAQGDEILLEQVELEVP